MKGTSKLLLMSLGMSFSFFVFSRGGDRVQMADE
jgi:hypothetical protein